MSVVETGGGRLFAVPFDTSRGDPLRYTRLLDHIAANVNWFATAMNPEEARANALWMMGDTAHWKWDVYNGGTFAGIFLIHRITPKVDAQFHFTLLPQKETGVTLFGSRKLVWNFLGYVFEAFQLQRISVEIPEYHPKLAHWFRQRLHFRYEGERDIERLRKTKCVTILPDRAAETHIAAVGSRRERSHWDGTVWRDLILMRLLASEYADYNARASLGKTPEATRSTLELESSAENVVKGSPRNVPANAAAGESG